MYFIVLALALAASASSYQDQWSKFKTDFNRKYDTPEEDMFRFKVFLQNLKRAEELNANPNDKAEYGVTKFMDLTEEEFSLRLGYKQSNVSADLPKWDGKTCYSCKKFPNLNDLPASIDWTTLGAVNPIKDQGQCGSCWTFSTVVGLEGAWFMAGNKLTSLSEEEIVQCDNQDGNQGCDGGDMTLAYQWVVKNGGINSEAAYPYTSGTGNTGRCSTAGESRKVAHIDGAYYISSKERNDVNETFIMDALAKIGPLSIGINAAHLQTYVRGVLSPEVCRPRLDHGVAMVGYGTDRDKTYYWKVRNSWGKSWGEDGYFRIARGSNTCGIADDVSVGYLNPSVDSEAVDI